MKITDDELRPAIIEIVKRFGTYDDPIPVEMVFENLQLDNIFLGKEETARRRISLITAECRMNGIPILSMKKSTKEKPGGLYYARTLEECEAWLHQTRSTALNLLHQYANVIKLFADVTQEELRL